MLKKLILPAAFVLSTLALTWSNVTLADYEDARALEKAKISLVEAIQLAERETQGRAFEAQIDHERFGPEFEVSVLVGQTIYEVKIDAQTGAILSVREDHDD